MGLEQGDGGRIEDVDHEHVDFLRNEIASLCEKSIIDQQTKEKLFTELERVRAERTIARMYCDYGGKTYAPLFKSLAALFGGDPKSALAVIPALHAHFLNIQGDSWQTFRDDLQSRRIS